MSTPVEPEVTTPTAGTPSTTAPAPLALWDEVVRARLAFALQRRGPKGPSAGVVAARAELLSALELYVESLEHRRLPVPYALRDELRIQQLTRPAGTSRSGSSGGER